MAARSGPMVARPVGEPSLFLNDRELHHWLAPHLGRDRFQAAIRACEHRGFPRVNSLFRGRYWPLVREWLDRDNGVGINAAVAGAQDGPEQFDVPTRRQARIEAQAERSTLLGRQTDRAQSIGLP